MKKGEVLEVILREQPAPIPATDLSHYFAGADFIRERFSLPIDRAVVGGFVSDRLGFAFFAGYQAAVSALVPVVSPRAVASFCVTEEGGNHPRAVHTQLERAGDAFVLTGSKRWCIASAATLVVVAVVAVVAREGTAADGRPKLRAVLVDASAPGVTLTASPPTPFTPEVLHAEAHFDRVELAPAALLPGDGYDDYTKPFRTVEDLHVQAALLGYLSGVALRSAWPNEVRERLAALIVTARGLAVLDPARPETHVALSGFLAATAALVAEADAYWAATEVTERERWYRDRMLVQVAGKARAARRERAWQRLASEKP